MTAAIDTMPGRDLGIVLDSSESPVLGLLRPHKSLPKPRRPQNEDSQSLGSFTTSERIRSWIPDPHAKTGSPAPEPSVTPSIDGGTKYHSWIHDARLNKPGLFNDMKPHPLMLNRVHTSDKSRSEARSDSFAPGDDEDTEDQYSISNFGYPTHFTPSPQEPGDDNQKTANGKHINLVGSRHFLGDGWSNGARGTDKNSASTSSPSTAINLNKKRESIVTQHTATHSQADSFQTASENFHHREDTRSPSDGHAFQSQQDIKRHNHYDARAVGLGLGLESEHDTTPEIMTPKAGLESPEYLSFAGVWGGDTPGRINDHLQDRKRQYIDEPTPVVHDDLLEEGADRHRQTSSTTPPLSLQIEQLSDPSLASPQFSPDLSEGEVTSLEAHVREMADKRLSGASMSTVVSAMVVDSPPRRRQTLRHTGRILDAEKTDKDTLASISLNSTPSLKRRNRHSGSPTSNLRDNFSADAVRKTDRRPPPQLQKFVVLPDRRGSLQSSASSSKRLSKTFSAASRQQSSRPTTAPEEGTATYFDTPRTHRRSVSVVINQARPVRHTGRLPSDVLSPITQSSTKSSAPLSKQPSHSTSTASGGLTTQLTPASPPPQAETLSPEPDTPDYVHDPRRSTLSSDHRLHADVVTPFSLRSTHSSTPGTLEVNEATALSIHPHTNKSILVIQEIANRDGQDSPREHSAVIASNASIAIPGRLAPLIHNQPLAVPQITDSPLQNPRDAPPPPEVIQVIPPTPANAHTSSEAIVAAGEAARANRRTAPLSGIRRAFSAKQFGESAVRHRASLGRSFSLRPRGQHYGVTHRYSFTSADERESKLHPTWRPRRYTTASSDTDSDFGNGVHNPTPPLNTDRKVGRTRSLTNRITSTIRSASLRRGNNPRRSASNSHPYPSTYRTSPLPYEVVDDVIKRRQPLARRLSNSLRLPSRRRRSPSDNFPSTHVPVRRQTLNFAPYERPVNGYARDLDDRSELVYRGSIGRFGSLRERLGRVRSLREDRRAEKRREVIRGNVHIMGPEEYETDEEVGRGYESGF